jgi:hypothetical protein
MLNCPHCGCSMNEADSFCGKCGTALNNQPPSPEVNASYPSYPPKSSTNFGNGLLIGASATVIIFGLFTVNFLNNYVNQQTSILSHAGVAINEIQYRLLDITSLIGLIASFAIICVYLLSYGLLNQFSSVMRLAVYKKTLRFRLVNGLFTGGFLLTAFSTESLLQDFYNSSFSSFGFTSSVLLISGLLIVAAGFLVMLSLFRESGQQKFKGKTNVSSR